VGRDRDQARLRCALSRAHAGPSLKPFRFEIPRRLAANNAALDEYEAKVSQGADRALAFVRQYRNPAAPNPPPIAPEVAAPPPAEEPPVFTDVSSPVLAPDETSGGFAPIIAGEFVLPGVDDAPATDG
jgi:hypothetical protein